MVSKFKFQLSLVILVMLLIAAQCQGGEQAITPTENPPTPTTALIPPVDVLIGDA